MPLIYTYFFCDLVLKAKRHEILREYAVCQQKCVNLRIGICAILK